MPNRLPPPLKELRPNPRPKPPELRMARELEKLREGARAALRPWPKPPERAAPPWRRRKLAEERTWLSDEGGRLE